ncbi:hypothetical protein [Streptomyces sp. V3I7]|uniref:TolB family protein n=1 Tax=Streptomyces sp. V3I7 TaxID=3042278 RepID=UPI0027D82BD6|nr:hypothetical protein [Streptomyces sp. V3I7]
MTFLDLRALLYRGRITGPDPEEGAQVRFKKAALTVTLAIATSLPLAAGTATAEETQGPGRLTGTDYSGSSPALVSLNPVSGSVTATLAQGAEDGVLSPSGSQVAYIHRRDTCTPQTEGCAHGSDLVVAGADGSDAQVLVAGIGSEAGGVPYVGHPDWSPDGERVVYETETGLGWIKADGTGGEVLTPYGTRGTFSPDGRSIAFLRSTSYETEEGWDVGTDVYVLNTDTREERQLTTSHDVGDSPVDWSPDGSRLVYATDYDLHTVDVATGAITSLPNQWTPALSYFRTPVYSPDGTRFAFNAFDQAAGASATYVVDAADGGNLRKLTDRPTTFTDWLPNE